MNSFKDRLKQIMSERKISQSELSRRTGIGRNSISDYLNGKYEAKQDKVFELAKALNVNEAWLMGFDISKNRKIEKNDITSIYNKLTPPRQENVLNYANEQLDEQNKVTSIDGYKESKLVSYIACGATGAGIGEELYDDI
ncbi:TPA: helix-turn-helix domain-containing protein, partial [Staphylococcus aureus]